ncbi:MAG: hypothetical protein Q8R55_07335 [Candidatus Taylorbacteria bacterium]|nr:hypothetical protein [Candidatus Taylorbacteria bacterium]
MRKLKIKFLVTLGLAFVLLAIPLPSVIWRRGSADISDLSSYTNLPVKKIKNYSVENSKGTAIFFPQYHRYPESRVSDPVNNSPQRSQEEIYSVLDHLVSGFGIDLLLVEGELYGKVPPVKIENLSSREIILKGASVILKSKKNHLILFGTENEDTLKESGILVKDYITKKSPELEKKIQDVVVDRRNKEAAKNFARTLQETDKRIGIIQFGAGHTAGLIKELNRQGISVIVVTTDEAAKRQG